MEPRSHSKVLVFRIGELGDTIVAMPAFEAIRAAFPDARITLLTNSPVRSWHVPAAEVLPRNGLIIDEIITYPRKSRERGFAASIALVRQLRTKAFDAVVYLAPRRRTWWRVFRDYVLFQSIGARRLYGFRRLRRGPNASDVVHEVDYLLAKLEASGIPVPDKPQRRVNLYLTDGERAVARAWLQRVGGAQHDRPIAVTPGSKMSAKMWPIEFFEELGTRLVKELGVYPIIVGGYEDRDLGERLLRSWPIGANAAGIFSVRESLGLLSLCSLYVGNDSGPMHLAAAAGVDCVAIFSARDQPGKWDPYGVGGAVLRRDVSCGGCLLVDCDRNNQCLRLITVEEVMTACSSVLGGPVGR